MYKVYIVDDELKAIDNLEYLIKQVLPEVSKIGRNSNSINAAQEIHKFQPDILFLDIQMPHLDGFGLLKTLGKIDFDVIFVTAYEDYAINAIKISALDYLLKPIDEDDLRAAFEKFLAKKDLKNEQKEEIKLSPLRDKIAIHQLEGIHFLYISDIIRMESDGNYTKVYSEGNQMIISSKTLKCYQDALEGEDFIRVHNSHFVNAKKIKSIIKYEYLLMNDGSNVPLSRRKKKDLKIILGLD